MSKITEACGLGEAIHGAFRKATICPQAHPIWKLIEEMPAREWNAVLDFIYEAMPEGVQLAMEEELVVSRR